MKFSITKKLAGMVIAGSTAIFTMMPMTAFAQVPEEDSLICICETKCDEEHINQECAVCSYDYNYCEGTPSEDNIPEETTEETEEESTEEKSTEEKVEEAMGPLTPDGNLTIVDDYGSLEAGGKQFITVVTKAGNYFYIIIDRDDHGNENVHFLNMVDESDLLALMDDEQVEEYMNKTGVGEKDGQASVVEDVTETEVEEPEVEVEKPVKKNNSGMIVIVLLVIGGATKLIPIIKDIKPKTSTIAPKPVVTEQTMLMEKQPTLPSVQEQKNKKKKKWPIVVGALLILVIIGVVAAFVLTPNKAIVPDVTNYTLEEAIRELESKGFVIGETEERISEEIEAGKVISTTPSANLEKVKGTKIDLIISNGEETVTMDNFVTHQVEQARSFLESQGFKVNVNYEFSDKLEGEV